MKAPPFLYRYPGFGSLLATGSNAVATFLVFRFAYRLLGPSPVGIWAIIQGIMLISRLADGGSGGNVTRLVAIEKNSQGGVKLRNFLVAGLLLGTGPIIVLGLLILYPTYRYVALNYAQALPGNDLFILSASSLLFGIFSSLGTILSGCLDGLGLMALRGYLACIANILFVAFGLFGINWLGIPGLGLAYVAYAIFTVLLLAAALSVLDFSPPSDWAVQPIRAIIEKTLRFNLGYFVLSICQLLMDPVCKIFIGQFSSLEAVAIFDLANKITTQARVIYQAATQSILPLVSRESLTLEANLRSALLGWNKLITHCALYTMSAVVLLSGHIALFTLGKVHPEFIVYVVILACANALNAAGLVGYYIDVGSGRLRHLLRAFIGMAVLNVMLGGALGFADGALGIILGYAIALAAGGLACAKVLISTAGSVMHWLIDENFFELALFAANCIVALYAMAWLKYENPVLSTFLVLTMLGVTTAAFAIREAGGLRSRLGYR